MKYFIGILGSGNYAISLNRALKNQGSEMDVIPTPCKLSRTGCSYCIRFPVHMKDVVIKAGIENKTPILEVYEMEMVEGKRVYKKAEL